MAGLRGLFSFYIDSSLHVAFSVFAFTYITYLEMGVSPSFDLLGFVFFATVLGYNFVKYYGFLSYHSTNPNWRVRLISLLSLVSSGMALFFLQRLDLKSILTVALLALLTFFYAMPVSVAGNRRIELSNLRGLFGFKIYIIAIVWTSTTCLLPILESDFTVLHQTYALLLNRFLWVLVLMIPFEIRDLKYDALSLGTLPQRIGIQGAKYLGYVLLGIICLVTLNTVTSLETVMITVVVAVISAVCIRQATPNQGRFYSAFWVEGIPLLWMGLLLVFS